MMKLSLNLIGMNKILLSLIKQIQFDKILLLDDDLNLVIKQNFKQISLS